MKVGKILLGLALASQLMGCESESIKVMSFNALCPVCDVGSFDPWSERLVYFEDLFRRNDPDLIGTQELLSFQNVNEIAALLPDHEAVRVPAGSATLTYPDSMIFYRRGRFTLLESGTYWLSQRPDVSWFPAWDVLSLPRIVIWARLYDHSNQTEFIFLNSHFDNNGGNKVPSANLFMDRAVLGADLPIIAAGDFNSKPESPSYEILVEGNDGPGGFAFTNAFDTAQAWRVATNTGLDEAYGCGDIAPGSFPDCRIDHILVGGDATWTVTDWVVDVWQYGQDLLFPSDHRAIQAEIELG